MSEYLKHTQNIAVQDGGTTMAYDWFAHNNNVLSQPRIGGNIVEPLVCGEETFSSVYDAIFNAKTSVDIISWGFDPAMRFKRNDPKALTLGELLKAKAQQGVEVRVLIWNNPIAQLGENSVIGEGWFGAGGSAAGTGLSGGSAASVEDSNLQRAKLEQEQKQIRDKIATIDPDDETAQRNARDELIANKAELATLDTGYIHGSGSGGTVNEPQANKTARDWYRWAMYDAPKNLELKTRDIGKETLTYHDDRGLQLHFERISIFLRTLGDDMPKTSIKQKLAMALFPSHHQKTVVVDYMTPANAVGFVMGHNMHRNYWDTTAHLYDDNEAGRDIGFGPWQDLSSKVYGPVLFDLNHNFCNAWDTSTWWLKNLISGPLSRQRINSPLNFIKNGGEAAQICRTQSEEGPETSILEVYEKALGNVNQYAYIENQYFRYKTLAEHLKATAANGGCRS